MQSSYIYYILNRGLLKNRTIIYQNKGFDLSSILCFVFLKFVQLRESCDNAIKNWHGNQYNR